MKSAAFSPATGSTFFIPRQEVEMAESLTEDRLKLYGRTFTSRLLLGTADRIGACSSFPDAMETSCLQRTRGASR
jgi:hypothetical protein